MRPDTQRAALVAALQRGHSVTVRLWGGSMRPLVPPGSRVRIEPVDREHPVDDASPGDLLVVVAEQKLIAHRLVRVEGEHVELVSDSTGSTARFPVAGVIGRVGGVVLFGRQLQLPTSLQRRVNGIALQSTPALRQMRRWRRALQPVAGQLRSAAAPWLEARLLARLEVLDEDDVEWLETAWIRWGHSPAPLVEGWHALASRKRLFAARTGERLLALIEAHAGGPRVTYLDSRIASSTLQRGLERAIRQRAK